jgi:hypothetical protein
LPPGTGDRAAEDIAEQHDKDDRHQQAADDDVGLACAAQHELTQRHPWYAEAAMERPPVTPHGLAAFEHALSILDNCGLTIVDRVGVVSTLGTTVMSVSINAAAEARTRARLRMTEGEMMSTAGAYLGRITASGQFPASASS